MAQQPKKGTATRNVQQRPTAPPPGKPSLPAKQHGGAMVLVQDEVPDYLRGMQQNARGSEEVTVQDLVIPRLEIVQGLSPAVKRGDPGFIQGAAMGMLNNSVTRALYGDSVHLINVYFNKQWLVWKDRKFQGGNEGGFFGAYNNPDEALSRADQEGGIEQGIMVVDTPTHLCLIITDDGIDEIMIPMPRTKAKVSRNWNAMIRLKGGDRFSRVYKVSTVLQKNKLGDFYNFSAEPIGFPTKALFQRAEELYTRVASGERKVVMDASYMEPEHGDDGAGSTAEM